MLLELEPDSDPVWHYLTIQVTTRGILQLVLSDDGVRAISQFGISSLCKWGVSLANFLIIIDDGLQDRRIRGLLEACSLEHDVRMDALHGRVRERVQSDARWKQLQRESNKAVCELLGKNLLISARLVWQIHFNIVNL